MINQVVKGAMTYLKRPFILKFDENEPKVYKLQVVRGNVIKEDAIVAYAAQAAAVPESTIIMAKNALFDAINYFCANGRRVMVPNLGSFAPVTRCKVARNEADCDTRTIKHHQEAWTCAPLLAIRRGGCIRQRCQHHPEGGCGSLQHGLRCHGRCGCQQRHLSRKR